MPRPFDPPNSPVATDVQVLKLISQISHDDGIASYNFRIEYDVLDAEDQSMSKHVGDASSVLTTGEITQLTNIVNRLLSEARDTLPS